ncbi:YccF domain-containing protein, partial [Vibrio cholerae]
NIIWFILAGFWLAVGHILSAVACFITIIGIPFALQHLKLAVISLAPIGKTVVPIEEAARARYRTR